MYYVVLVDWYFLHAQSTVWQHGASGRRPPGEGFSKYSDQVARWRLRSTGTGS